MLLEKVKELKKDVIEFATLVESMLNKSIKGWQKSDVSLLKSVIKQDEPQANAFEISLDRKCTGTIAQFQPTAKDLRTILMVLKMGNDFERLGDEAVSICKAGLYLIENPKVRISNIDIPKLADIAIGMLKDSISAFINEDARLATLVCERDNTVDKLRDDTLTKLVTFIGNDPTKVVSIIRMMDICRKLERVADLSTNLCEDIIFIVEGRVIKHAFNQ